MVTVDGAMGEGGGQVLRSALTLAVITGRNLRIHNIRAGRSKPGLRPQHVASATAASEICGGRLSGADVGSTTIEIEPGKVRGGTYRFGISTAGAASLVLQTIVVPLSFADEPSDVEITGGTHVPWSPCFEYLEHNWLPVMAQVGYRVSLQLSRAGFYPRGGGLLRAQIMPADAIKPVEFVRRGALRERAVLSGVSRLPRSIAERQRDRAQKRLKDAGPMETRILDAPGHAPGTFLVVQAVYEAGRACFFGLGRKGKPAERVADEAVNQWQAFQSTGGAIDRYLADQLLLPLAMADGPSALTTERITSHLETNAAIIQQFLPVKIEIEGEREGAGRVRVIPRPRA